MKTVLIFSGYNMRAIFAFLRTADKYQVPCKIIASSSDDAIFKTAYKNKVVATRKSQALDIDAFIRLLRKVAVDCPNYSFTVAPSTEALNRFFLKHRAEFEALHIEIPLCEEPLYVSISDKASFTQLCRNAGIAVPEECESIASHILPCVAKPKRYKGEASGKALKPIIVENESELEGFLDSYETNEFFFQKYITGNSYYFLYYFFKDAREPLMYSQENLVQQKCGGSILAAVNSNVHQSDLAQNYKNLFQHLGFTGLVMVEVRGSLQEAKMIEANPRFWGPSQLFVDAGVNFFSAFLNDNGFNVPFDGCAGEDTVRYFWDDGESFETGSLRTTAFHHYSAEKLKIDYRKWDGRNLFKRPDTIELYEDFIRGSEMAKKVKLVQLRDLYNKASKHSNYQILPPLLNGLISKTELETLSRYEKERFDVISKHIALKDKHVLDIGGNTGYFSFEALREGAKVSYCEGNVEHAKFVTAAVKLIDRQSDITVNNHYYLFNGEDKQRYDVVFLLNVLHHIGDDYGDTALSKEKAKESIICSLRSIAKNAKTLVFQLGFNWKGDRKLPLFETGTKTEMLTFLKKELSDLYEFENIYIAEPHGEKIVYRPLSPANIARRDDLGEFLNRPLMIMRVIHSTN